MELPNGMTPDPETMVERHKSFMRSYNRRRLRVWIGAVILILAWGFLAYKIGWGAEPMPPRPPDGSVKADAPVQVIQVEIGHALETCLKAGGIALQTHEWNGRIWWWCLSLPQRGAKTLTSVIVGTVMSDHELLYDPATSQRQADFFEHAAHDLDYANERGVPQGVAKGRHAATVAAGLWGKTADGPCFRCEEKKREAEAGD